MFELIADHAGAVKACYRILRRTAAEWRESVRPPAKAGRQISKHLQVEAEASRRTTGVGEQIRRPLSAVPATAFITPASPSTKCPKATYPSTATQPGSYNQKSQSLGTLRRPGIFIRKRIGARPARDRAPCACKSCLPSPAFYLLVPHPLLPSPLCTLRRPARSATRGNDSTRMVRRFPAAS